MKNLFIAILIVVFSLNTSLACTTAIFSGKITKSGLPLIWKHRDSDFSNNKIVKFKYGSTSCVALVNSHDKTTSEIWAGYNNHGFGIMNSASYNLRKKNYRGISDQEGVVMKKAIQQCRTIQDFQSLLDTLHKPSGLEANFGVVDASGAAAYFETDDYSYTKIDCSNKLVAPKSYIIRTNYSFSGRENEGYGYIRYKTAQELIEKQLEVGKISPEFIFKKLSKSVYNSLTGDDISKLRVAKNESKIFNITDCINRYSSVSSIVIKGVNSEKNTHAMSMWVMLGSPLLSLPVVIFNNDSSLPSTVTAPGDKNSTLCDLVLKAKKLIFPRKVESNNYINLSAYTNYERDGYKERISKVENSMYFNANYIESILNSKSVDKEILKYYKKVDKLVNDKFEVIVKNLK